MKALRLAELLTKHLVRSGVFFHLILGVAFFHWGAQMVHFLFRSEIFGDLSLSSVIPVPTRSKLNLWILVGSGFFSASVLGTTIVPYFFTGGRERAMSRVEGTWWRFSLLSFSISFLWFTLLFVVQFVVSQSMSDFSLKPSVSLFRIWFVWISICVSLTYTVGWLSLFLNPGVSLLVTAIGTLGILLVSMLERFGVWGIDGISSFPKSLIPSGDLGFDFWKWLNGEAIPASVMVTSLVSASLMVLVFAMTLRYLRRFRRTMLRG